MKTFFCMLVLITSLRADIVKISKVKEISAKPPLYFVTLVHLDDKGAIISTESAVLTSTAQIALDRACAAYVSKILAQAKAKLLPLPKAVEVKGLAASIKF